MPKQVKLPKNREFVFKAVTRGGPAASKYDWDAWLNGDLLMLEQSTGDKDDKGNVVQVDQRRDYDGPTEQMPGKIKTAARKRYKVVQVSKLDHNGEKLVNSLIIKARDMDDDERAAEDVRRAEEKADQQAKKAERSQAVADAGGATDTEDGKSHSEESETEAA